MDGAPPLPPLTLTLGLLAGGAATRLGGIDKAWLQRDRQPQVLRLARLFAPRVAQVLVSTNRTPGTYAAHGLGAVPDLQPGLGPIGGLHALAAACATPWLLTLPVDALHIDAALADRLANAGAGQGAWLHDADGPQPLAALWNTEALRTASAAAIASGNLAVHALHRHVGNVPLHLPGLRMGNLNTPADLVAAGMEPST